MTDINALGRAELAALVAATLPARGIEVVLVGGSCVCLYTSERFASFDLNFVVLCYSRQRKIADALQTIGFQSQWASNYFESDGCQGSLEFPSAPLAVGQEQITAERVAGLENSTGTVRLLSPTDCVQDRLLWWYLERNGQCREQALDAARNPDINREDLAASHDAEGYAHLFGAFQDLATT